MFSRRALYKELKESDGKREGTEGETETERERKKKTERERNRKDLMLKADPLSNKRLFLFICRLNDDLISKPRVNKTKRDTSYETKEMRFPRYMLINRENTPKDTRVCKENKQADEEVTKALSDCSIHNQIPEIRKD